MPAVLFSVILSGCATFGQMEDGLHGLIGQDVSAAVNVLGFPSSEREIAGMKLVEWGRSNSAAIMMPTTSTTTGYAQSGVRTATFSSATTSAVPMNLNFQCHIALQVDSNNVIRRYQYEGNLGGCAPYIRALKQSADNSSLLSAAQRRMQAG